MASWEDVLKARSLSGVITLFDACERDNERIQRWRWPCLREAQQLQGVCACSSFNENWEQSLHGSTSSRATVAHTLALCCLSLICHLHSSCDSSSCLIGTIPFLTISTRSCDHQKWKERAGLATFALLMKPFRYQPEAVWMIPFSALKELEFPSRNAFCGLQEFRTETYSMLSICWLCLALSRKKLNLADPWSFSIVGFLYLWSADQLTRLCFPPLALFAVLSLGKLTFAFI